MQALSLGVSRARVSISSLVLTSKKIILLSILLLAGLLPQQLLAQNITNSAIFDVNDVSYLARTPASAGNQKTWTYSVWFKRANITGSEAHLFSQSEVNTNRILLQADNTLRIQMAEMGSLITSRVFRDVSEWYHLVIKYDTTKSIASERLQMFVNGVEETNFTTDQRSGLALDEDGNFNKALAHHIGRFWSGGTHYGFDGYMADINFIDGVSDVDHTAFGEFDSNGNWQPIEYIGSYGTNGFHLDYSDAANFGKDVSGNSNHFTDSGLSADHQVTDTPTNNFAVINPLTKFGYSGEPGTLEDGLLTVTQGANRNAVSTIGMNSGKWYMEVKVASAGSMRIGIYADPLGNVDQWCGDSDNGWAYRYDNGQKWHNNTGIAYGESWGVSDIIGIAYDADIGSLTFYKNGVSQGVAYSGLDTTKTYYFALTNGGGTAKYVANFGQRPFAHTLPTDFKALSAKNLPEPIIANPKEHFDVVTYTGSGSTQSITGIDHQPDLVWIKGRTAAYEHFLFDAQRGPEKALRSNRTNAETTFSSTLTSFDTDGFTLGNQVDVNSSGQDYVAWSWKAGETAVTNNDGTITSTVNANTTAGFSIVNWTGNATVDATIGHGLGKAPEIVIIKNRTDASDWIVGHKGMTHWNDLHLQLNNTGNHNGSLHVWGSGDNPPTSTVFYSDTDNAVNGSGDSMIAYAFTSVDGFSKIDSYTGNGSADGPFIHTGFKPAFVMIKRTDGGSEWAIYDSKRPGHNPARAQLRADASDSENTNSVVDIDLVSNGIKIRTSDAAQNANGGNYIYMAFAEKPLGPTVDETAPQLSETVAVPALTSVTDPAYSFSSNEAGTLQIGGSCSSAATTAVEGDNTITLTLDAGTYNDCTITVTDEAGNVSEPLAISDFTIDPDYVYEISNALEFNSSNGEYLSWTPTQAGNRTTWSWSAWVQRGAVGAVNTLLYVDGGVETAFVRFNSANELEVALGDGSTHSYESEAFSNSGDWSHLALSVDTTQANAADRIKLYLNGQLQTPKAGYVDPQQNAVTLVNSTNNHYVGNGGGSDYYDGAMADIRLVDSIALDASAFGKQTAQGVWVPVEYTSGGGSNSSYLNFQNTSNLGVDATNGNDWQVTGIDGDSQTAASPTTPPAAGFIPGELSVGQGGTASYTIPIGVPKGVAGMQPEISINYNSNGGNGLLGMGFSIGGLSAISRCPATHAQDGFKGGIYFNDKDRYCLDGQRLIAISGTDGADGTEYRTEIDGFSKIISYGQAGNHGPSYWKVWTKSGQIMEYGNSDDSKVEKTGSTNVRTWAVSSISDVVGNSISFNYHEDTTNGEHYPLSVDYGTNSVQFEYENRPDPFYGHQGGGKISLTQRLEKIRLRSSSSLVQEYSLRYRSGNKSLLAGVTHKDANGSAMPELTFDWDMDDAAEQKGFEPVERWSLNATHANQNIPTWRNHSEFLDINGDGLPDRVNHHNYTTGEYGIWVALNNGSGFDPLERWEYTATYSSQYDVQWGNGNIYSQFLDINGDGLPDRVNHHNYTTNEYGIWVALNNGSGFDPLERWEYTATYHDQYLPEWGSGGNVYSQFLDINGDGLPDRVNHHNYTTGEYGIWVALNNGSGFEPLVRWSFNATHVDQNTPTWGNNSQFLDINGDGLPDRVNHHNYTTGEYGIWVALNNGSGFDPMERWEYNATHHNQYEVQWGTSTVYSQFLDINGDGLPDRVNHHNYTTGEYGIWVALNNGSGFEPLVRWSFDATHVDQNIPTWSNNSQFLDINGDGLPDRVNHHNYTTGEYGIWVALNNGSGFDPMERWEYAAGHSTQYDVQWGTSDIYSQFVDIDGDGKLDRVNHHNYTTNEDGIWVALGKQRAYKVRSISSGMTTTSLTYKPLTDTSVYTKGAGSTYPEIDLAGPMQVVSKVTTPDGLGGTHSTDYTYGGLKVNTLGRGSLGFAWMEATNNQTGIVTKTEYSQTFPYVGQVTRTEQRLADDTLLGETTTTFNHTTSHSDKVYFPYTEQTVDKKYDLSGTLLATTTTDNVFDAFANPTQITVTTVDSEDTVVKDTLSDYTNNTDIWHLGRLTRSSVTHTNNQGSITRTSAFTYNSNGLLETEIIEPDDPALRLQTDYQYDSYGNKIQVTTSGQGIETRSSSTTYSADGRFPETVTNALGHTETRTYDPVLGTMASLTGPNGLTTSWQYDGFGRKIREDRADGTWSTISRGQCGVTDCPEDAPTGTGLHTTNESSGSTPVTVFSDKLGRVVRKVKTGFDGTLVYEDTEYNSLGQISRKSQPYFKGDSAHWGDSEYDILGRVTKISQQGPNEVIENNFSYSGFTSTSTNAKGHVKTTRKNAQGKVVRVDEEEGGWVTYKYDAIGNLLETDANGILTTLTYDLRGRKATMDDPGMGQWTYDYDVLGKLISQTDAKSQTISMTYDKLGRMVQRVEPEGTTNWTYDTATNGIGKLAQVAAPDGYLKVITYDSLGRASTTTTTADGKTLTTTTEYDSLSRVSRTIRPEGFVLDNAYNAWGYLEAVHSPTAQIGDYDADHLAAVRDEALAIADLLLQQVEDYNVKSATYRQRAADYDAYAKHIPQNGQIVSLLRTAADSLEAGGELNSVVGTLNSAHALLDPIVAAYNALLALPETAENLNKTAAELEQLAADTLALAENYLHWAENPTLNATLVENADIYQQDIDDTANVYFWRAKSRDAAGRLTSSIVGNGLETTKTYDQATGQLTDIISGFGYAAPIRELNYEYDNLNNVISRIDHVQGMTESFEYDRQDRLTQSYVNGQIGDVSYDYTKTYSYDAMGNMINKSDIGDYTYGDQNRTTGNAGPHALLSAGPDHTNYQYDLNGNMLQGGGRDITWSSFNKPTEFRKDGTLQTTFKYGPDRSRYLKITQASRTLYLGKAYERIETGDKVEHKHFVYADGQLVAIHVKTTDAGVAQQDKTRYLHRDSLGSIDTITDGQGNIVDRMSYEPFGARRGGDWRVGTEAIVIPALTNRGFTGHEHVDEMNLIHMNGRVYDPQLGRFLSADPHIQSPTDSQSYNRYSYVLNNPLKYTDPSGYFFKKLFKKIKKFFRKVIKTIKKYIRPILQFAAYYIGGPIAAAITTAAIVKADGGSWGDAFKAGFISFARSRAFAQLRGMESGFEKIVAHGVIEGLSSVATGGKFKQGFLSGAFKQIFREVPVPKSAIGRILVRATAGGIRSVLGGGKFINGARTMAYQAMFRELPGLYEKVVGYEIDMNSGGGAANKGLFGMPVEGANNIGTQREWEFNDEGERVIGFFEEGGPVSRFMNEVWGVNAVSGMHDYFQVSMGDSIWRDVLNVPGMFVAAGITYSGFVGETLNNANIPDFLYVPTKLSGKGRKRRHSWEPINVM